MRRRYFQFLIVIAVISCMLPSITLWYLEIAKCDLEINIINKERFSTIVGSKSSKRYGHLPHNGQVEDKNTSLCNHVGKRIYSKRETAATALKKRTLVSLHWQMADDNCNVYVYSSYLDDLEWEIRILGMAKVLNSTISVRCHIWNASDDNNPKPVEGHIGYLPDIMKRSYSAVIISCPVKERSRPFAISVTTNNSTSITNIIKITYPSQKNKNNITVCGPVLHSHYKHVHAIISFIEMNILLGAQRFVLYNYSVTPEVSLVLSGYVKEGLLELVQWDIPVKDIHYFGQNVIINDCLYKHLHVSRYLAYSDVDELIMPQKHKTWMALIQSVRKRTPNVGSIAFRNTFFGTNGNWRMDTKGYNQSKEARLYRVTPLLRVWRDKKILPAFSRTKQIVIPERVRSVRIHLVDKHMYRKQFEAYVVSPKDGLLYHYRWVSGVKEKIKDDRLRTYSDMLLSSVKRRHFQFVTGKKV